MTLGERIRAKRESLKLSREDLGHLVGVSHVQIMRYENGDNQPTANILIALARAFNVSTDWLLGIIEELENGDLEFSPQEIEIVMLYREKSPERRRAALEIMKWA